MANAAGWNPSDKSADITLASPTYFGTNTLMLNTATGSWRSARTAALPTSGKLMVHMVTYQDGTSGFDYPLFGLANGSATLSNYAGFDNNAYGVQSGAIVKNNSVLYNFNSQRPPYSSGQLQALCINRDTTPNRGHWRSISFENASTVIANADSGWRDFSGTVSDPTNNSQGTDISGLGSSLYIIGSAIFNTTQRGLYLNMGGWPFLDLIPLPSGYVGPDANYPYTMPAGSFTLSNNSTPALVTIYQNNMRAVCLGNGGGTKCRVYSSAFPSGSKTLHAMVWDKPTGTRSLDYCEHILTGNGVYSDAARWSYDGSTTNLGGATWPAFYAQPTYMAIDRTNNKAWGTLDGTTWYGNGGASPNPATNTNGADISGLTALSTLAPGASMDSNLTHAVTFNAGRTTDPITVPSGFRWLDTGATPRARIYTS